MYQFVTADGWEFDANFLNYMVLNLIFIPLLTYKSLMFCQRFTEALKVVTESQNLLFLHSYLNKEPVLTSRNLQAKFQTSTATFNLKKKKGHIEFLFVKDYGFKLQHSLKWEDFKWSKGQRADWVAAEDVNERKCLTESVRILKNSEVSSTNSFFKGV